MILTIRRHRLKFLSLVALLGLTACTGTGDHYVIASTGTVIGVEVAQNPANQTPQAKLGYNRAELAIVPTNRMNCMWDETKASWICSPSQGAGAKDSPDVLMELRYGGIFDLGASSGIYQRLAVGTTAVSQPGAAAMFVKNADGAVDQNAVNALKAIEAIPEQSSDVRSVKAKLSAQYGPAGAGDKAKFDQTATELGKGHKSFKDFVLDKKTTAADTLSFINILKSKGVAVNL